MLIALEVLETYNLVIDAVDIHNTIGVGLSLTDLYGDTVIDHTRVESCKNTAKYKGGNFVFHMNNKTANHVIISNSFFRYGYNIHEHKYYESSGVYIQIDCSASINITFDNVNLVGNHGINGGNILIIINININT